MKNGRFGIINIGASAFRMFIADYSGAHQEVLDYLIKPLRLGADTFTQGYISLDNVKKATEILTSFRLKLEEYDIKSYKAVCTSGVREASNRDFFVDYANINAGVKLEILDPNEEVYIKYVGAKNSVDNFDKLEKDGLIFANVSSGNVSLNITSKNKVAYAGTLPYGSLRLRQIFKSISHLKRHKAIEEYVRIMVSSVSNRLDTTTKPSHLVGAGSSINLMLGLFKPEGDRIYAEQLEDVYQKVKTMTLNDISDELGVRKDEGSVLVPTLIIYMELLKTINSKYFTFSRTSFPQLMSMYYMGRVKDHGVRTRARITLQMVANKYKVDVRHAKRVVEIAEKLFDDLFELHFMDENSKLALAAAAMLNDTGLYVGDENLAGNSYYIISALSVPGVEGCIFKMAAAVVYEANRLPKDPDRYAQLSGTERLEVKKLAAILRVAKALDAGYKKRIKEITVEIKDHIVIEALATTEPYLEMYAFDKDKQLFTEIFGVGIELRVKVKYD